MSAIWAISAGWSVIVGAVAGSDICAGTVSVIASGIYAWGIIRMIVGTVVSTGANAIIIGSSTTIRSMIFTGVMPITTGVSTGWRRGRTSGWRRCGSVIIVVIVAGIV